MHANTLLLVYGIANDREIRITSIKQCKNIYKCKKGVFALIAPYIWTLSNYNL